MAIKALERIRHNGEVYEPDNVISDMNPKEEERLIELGAASPFNVQDIEETEPEAEPKENENEEDTIEVPDAAEMSIKEIEEELKSIDEVEVLQGMLEIEQEQGEDARKGAIEAIVKRLKEAKGVE